ncbi:MAG: acyl-CoA desaturase [Thermoanaerobaculia bacterium]
MTTNPWKMHRVRASAVGGFLLVHLAAIGVVFAGFSWAGIALCLASYYLRMFAVTAGFHRYFSHRTYKLGRVPQFLLAFLGGTAAQKGVLWWASHHRNHHKYSDTPADLHSPVQYGFLWSHIGWILSEKSAAPDYANIPDLVKYPELRWLDRNQYLPTMLYAIALTLAFGPVGLVYGYFLSTVLLWHGTFSINSIMHVFGRRVFGTSDDSRNSMIFALVTMGEGWHNNHHFYPGSAAQGFRWWQIDMSYYALWIGEKLRIVRGLRRPPQLAALARTAIKSSSARLDAALTAAGDAVGDRIDRLSAAWAEVKKSAHLSANHAIAELEGKRIRTVARLEALQADYAAARASAGASAQKRLDELRAEIEKARASLAEILEGLLANANALPQPA